MNMKLLKIFVIDFLNEKKMENQLNRNSKNNLLYMP